MLSAYLQKSQPAPINALGDSEALFRILENLPMALGVAEPVLDDGTIAPDASVTFYNKKWRDLFGFGTDEVKNVTQATERLYPDPEMRRRNIAWREKAAATARETGRAVNAVELLAMGAGGKWIHVISSTTMVGGKMLVSMEDITARKQAEEALERALANEAGMRAEAEAAREAAERADKAKSLFLASMSHEVRTPLTSLIALARVFCLESEKLQLPGEFAELLGQIQSGGEYLNLILTNLLEVSAQEAGKARVQAEEFFVADWASDIGNILGPIAAANGVKLELDGPADSDARFRTDSLRLSQILLNLGHNALKFSGGGGRTVRVGISSRGENLEVRVRDEGPGIDPKRLPSLFGEFEQSEVKGPRHDRGVGLGLAVVARNSELLGGTVRARNVEPTGMEFTVVLPQMPVDGPSR